MTNVKNKIFEWKFTGEIDSVIYEYLIYLRSDDKVFTEDMEGKKVLVTIEVIEE